MQKPHNSPNLIIQLKLKPTRCRGHPCIAPPAKHWPNEWPWPPCPALRCHTTKSTMTSSHVQARKNVSLQNQHNNHFHPLSTYPTPQQLPIRHVKAKHANSTCKNQPKTSVRASLLQPTSTGVFGSKTLFVEFITLKGAEEWFSRMFMHVQFLLSRLVYGKRKRHVYSTYSTRNF